jgi:hypothetical protein
VRVGAAALEQAVGRTRRGDGSSAQAVELCADDAMIAWMERGRPDPCSSKAAEHSKNRKFRKGVLFFDTVVASSHGREFQQILLGKKDPQKEWAELMRALSKVVKS